MCVCLLQCCEEFFTYQVPSKYLLISIYYALLSAELCTRVRETEKILNLGVASSVKDAGRKFVDNAVANLEAKLDLDIRYQNDINRAVTALQTAIDSLNKNSADYTHVENAIALVQERENLIRDTYADTYGPRSG